MKIPRDSLIGTRPVKPRLLMVGLFALGACLLSGCNNKEAELSSATPGNGLHVEQALFGVMDNGAQVDLYTLRNAKGMEVKISTLGGVITSLKVPDRDGKSGEVILGFDDAESYLTDMTYAGPLIGRFGNRIAKGKFTLDGQEYTLETNNGVNHLHGGTRGFHKVIWNAEPVKTETSVGVKLTYVSPDMEGGYPGTLDTTAVYELNNRNELSLAFTATTDKPTPVNMTQHTYFNLSGGGSVLDHILTINADQYIPVDETAIPLDGLAPVAGTPFDFREGKPISQDINQEHPQLANAQGYDHNWVLNNQDPNNMIVGVRLEDPASGRIMEIITHEPGMQFYSGNFMNGTLTGKGGKLIEYRNGIALEPQHFPDSPNQPDFPDTILRPGEVYKNTFIYRFTTDAQTSAASSAH